MLAILTVTGVAAVWGMRQVQQATVASVVRALLAAPVVEAVSAQTGDPDFVVTRPGSDVRVVDPNVKAVAASFVRLHVVPCGKTAAPVTLRYDVGTPSPLTVEMSVRPPVDPRVETQLLFPAYTAFAPVGDVTKGTRYHL